MAKKTFKILISFVIGIGLLILLVATVLFLVDAETYKKRIEAAASQALGMKVSVNGSISIGFLSGTHVVLEDVHVQNREMEIAFVKSVRLGIDLLPLLHKEIHIGKIYLKQPQIFIERDTEGKFNFEKTKQASFPAMDLAEVSLIDATLHYVDKTGGEFEANQCKLEIKRLQLGQEKNPHPLKSLALMAKLDCAEVRAPEFTVANVKLTAQGQNGVVDFKPIVMHIFAGEGSGEARADFSGAIPKFNIHYTLPKFQVEEFLKIWLPQKLAEGPVNFSGSLSMQGNTLSALRETLDGRVGLRGENLTLIGSDIDRELSRFEASQSFNLVDAGAVFFAGPLGLVVTKGYNFANLLRDAKGNSNIRTFVSEWRVERGIAYAQDVAMATEHNRMALTGGLDFVNERFTDVTMALVDNKGCVKVRQKISGTFKQPKVEKPNVLKSLVGPAIKLLKKGKELLGGECQVFYDGSVPAPD